MEKLSISILNISFAHLEDSLEEFKRVGIERIHLDVIDTSFCENISFGPEIINQVLKYDFIFDMHLMIKKPLAILRQVDIDAVERVAVHCDYAGVTDFLESSGAISGIAVNPSESIPDNPVSYALIMTVDPGFGGQMLKDDCIYKVEQLQDCGVFCGIDGGITSDNIDKVLHSDLIVIGSDFVNSRNKEEYCRRIIKKM